MDAYLTDFGIARLVLQRGLAAVYLLAFLSALNQFRALLGEDGLLPVPRFLARQGWRQAPSIFQLGYSDRGFACVAWLGVALSLLALCGLSEHGPIALSFAVWFVLWVLYLSIVNVGQVFYGFGWESMLCEAGFFACFLGPSWSAPSAIPILLLRWMLFRVELGAGLIKIRHDSCWRDCTCLYYHYETQPIPNPLSRLFHRLPKPLHRASVLFSHFVQLVVPFGLFLPQPFAMIAGAFLVAHQLLLIVSGNYAWLNWLTVVLGASTLTDLDVRAFAERPLWFEIVLYVLLAVSLALSVQPTLNFFAKRQLMNFSYNPLHLLNVYGAFGNVTRERYEVVLEGTHDAPLGADAGPHDEGWREYEFKAKPGDPKRRPRQFAPYHLRLDWMMWFLPFGAHVEGGEVYVLRQDRWFTRLVEKLLEGDAATLALLRVNPFTDRPPRLIRARYYRYRYAEPGSGAFWTRELVGDFLPPTSLAQRNSAHTGA